MLIRVRTAREETLHIDEFDYGAAHFITDMLGLMQIIEQLHKT